MADATSGIAAEEAARPRSTSALGDDDALGEGVPLGWTREKFRTKVRGLLDSFLSSGEEDEALLCFRELLQGGPSGLDETVVCAARLALERPAEQREHITNFLHRLHREKVLDSPAIARAFAKLASAWEDMALDEGPRAPAMLVAMLASCISAGCVEASSLSRLPEGLLTATADDEATQPELTADLRQLVERMQEFKRQLQQAGLLDARISAEDEVERTARKLKELSRQEFHHEYVKRVLEASFDWPALERDRCASLFSGLVDVGVLSSEDVQYGAVRLLGALDDLLLDCPETINLTASHLRGLRTAGLLTGSFLRNCRALRTGGAKGLTVLELALEADVPSPSSPPVRLADEAEGKAEAVAEGEAEAATSEENQLPPASAPAPGATAAAPAKSSGLLSLATAGGTSLRPGGGLLTAPATSLRPGGGGGLTGSLTSAVLGAGGYPSKSGGGNTGKDASSGNWREAQQQRHRGGRDRDRDRDRDRRQGGGAAGKSRGGNGGATLVREDDKTPAKLEVSEASWAAQQKKHRQQVQAEADTPPSEEEITRRMKAILNKLTVEKFDELYRQLTQCGISTAEHVRILMIEVFEKATTQHHFIGMYTKLCTCLSDWFAEYVKVGNFKRILLDQCQASFEANLRSPEDLKLRAGATEEEKEALEERRLRHRQRMFGNIKFVGQLLVHRMVASKVLLACAEELLAADPADGALEPLAALLSTAGGEFDKQDWNYYKPFCSVFARVKVLAKDKALPARTRFLLQDVLDLRESGWVDKKQATKKLEGPTKLNEVSKPDSKPTKK